MRRLRKPRVYLSARFHNVIAHPAVKRINFTGSTRVGKIVARLAAEHLKPVLLELGGIDVSHFEMGPVTSYFNGNSEHRATVSIRCTGHPTDR
jgi:hypothetical protein